MKQNFVFASCFSCAHFPFATKNNQNVSPEWLFQRERQLWEQRAQLGTLVGLLLATTGLAASAMLELTSSASSGRFGICQQLDCNPHRLGAHVLVPWVCSWGDQGRKPDSAVSSTWGSLKKKLRRQWLACSNNGWLVFGSQGRLACGHTNLANPPSEDSWGNLAACRHSCLKRWSPPLAVVLVEPLLVVALWIHNVVGRLACQAMRMMNVV